MFLFRFSEKFREKYKAIFTKQPEEDKKKFYTPSLSTAYQ